MNGSQLFRSAATLAAVAVLAIPTVAAQTQGGGSQSGGSKGGSSSGSTGSSKKAAPLSREQPQEPRNSIKNTTTSPGPSGLRIRIHGKVIFDDGTPAPSGVAIECVGSRARQAVTNNKGRFAFVLGRSREAVYDASANGYYSTRLPGQPRTEYAGAPDNSLHACDLQASLPGYRSSKLLLAGFGRVAQSRPEGGTIILKPIGEVSGHTISATTLLAPEKARKAFDNGVTNAQAGKFEKAEKGFRKAVSIYPEYSEAWFHLGQVCEVQNKAAEARQAYHESIGADSRFASPYLRLAMMDTREAKWQAVVDATGEVIKMNPHDFPDAFYLNAVANLNLNQMAQAEKSARQAIGMNAWKKYPQVEHILGVALAHQGRYAEAKTHLKRYLEIYPDAANAEVVEMQLAQVESLLAAQTPLTGQSAKLR